MCVRICGCAHDALNITLSKIWKAKVQLHGISYQFIMACYLIKKRRKTDFTGF